MRGQQLVPDDGEQNANALRPMPQGELKAAAIG
jgi:hypothetical protein